MSTTEVKEKKKKEHTPRQYDAILKGALSLELNEQVALIMALKKSVAEHVAKADEIAKLAREVSQGI